MTPSSELCLFRNQVVISHKWWVMNFRCTTSRVWSQTRSEIIVDHHKWNSDDADKYRLVMDLRQDKQITMFKFRSFYVYLHLIIASELLLIHTIVIIVFFTVRSYTESDEKMNEPTRKKILMIGAENVGKGQGSKNLRTDLVRDLLNWSLLWFRERVSL